MTNIMVRHVGRSATKNLIQATPTLNGQRFNNFFGVIDRSDSKKKKLSDLGISTGMKFVIIKSENGLYPRNNWDAIWSMDELKDHQSAQKECSNCEFSVSKLNNWFECKNCPHGFNIIDSFKVGGHMQAIFKTKGGLPIT